MALAEALGFWHRTVELGQCCCPILAAMAEEAPKTLTLAGFHAIVHRARAKAPARRPIAARSATVALSGKPQFSQGKPAAGDRIFDNATALSRAEPKIRDGVRRRAAHGSRALTGGKTMTKNTPSTSIDQFAAATARATANTRKFASGLPRK